MPVVWMFPGQGAQFFGMGRSLMERSPVFRDWMIRLDDVAATWVGHSVLDVIHDPARLRSDAFDQLLHSHPALFMVQYAAAQALLAEGVPPPDIILGASLGEFVAAAVAGRIEPEDMLFDLIRQARLFDAQCAGGAMLAVIDDFRTFDEDPLFAGRCELAGVQFDRCFVVSGSASDIGAVAAGLTSRGVAHQRLPISIAFHSSHVDRVEDAFLAMFSGRAYRPAEVRLLSSAPSGDWAPATSAAQWWRVVRRPIAFRDALLALAAAQPDAVYLDVGPAGNLATFARYILPDVPRERILSVMSSFPDGGDGVEGVRHKLRALKHSSRG